MKLRTTEKKEGPYEFPLRGTLEYSRIWQHKDYLSMNTGF